MPHPPSQWGQLLSTLLAVSPSPILVGPGAVHSARCVPIPVGLGTVHVGGPCQARCAAAPPLSEAVLKRATTKKSRNDLIHAEEGEDRFADLGAVGECVPVRRGPVGSPWFPALAEGRSPDRALGHVADPGQACLSPHPWGPPEPGFHPASILFPGATPGVAQGLLLWMWLSAVWH